MSESTRMMLGLAIGIIVMIVLVMKTKIHTFIALLLAASCCVGAISFSYFNDSGFWVFNGMFGLTELKDQVKCKTAVSLIMAAVGVVVLMILQLFIH